MSRILTEKFPTGENLQLCSHIGPNRCALCTSASEDTEYLFLSYSATRDLWGLILASLNLHLRWEGLTIPITWDSWWFSSNPHKLCNLPTLFYWGIWIYHNRAFFQNTPPNWITSAAHIISIYQLIPDDPPPPIPWTITLEIIDHSYPLVYFDETT